MDHDITKLPKWVQEHINTIKRQRDTAINALNKWADKQTKSGFYFDDMLCLGEGGRKGPNIKRVYVQTHKMQVEHAGVILDIVLSGRGRGEYINLQYEDKNRIMGSVAMTPQSFQSIRLHRTGE